VLEDRSNERLQLGGDEVLALVQLCLQQAQLNGCEPEEAGPFGGQFEVVRPVKANVVRHFDLHGLLLSQADEVALVRGKEKFDLVHVVLELLVAGL
jgi:hypothetical protein